MGLFCCPVCKGALEYDGSGACCAKGHRFDRARQGYFNLLRSQSSSAKHHGDDRLMVEARRNFLSKDYYEPLRSRVCQVLTALLPHHAAIADIGCGEGYYTAEIVRALLDSGKDVQLAAIDISKDSVKLAARKLPKDTVAVASAFDLPIMDGSCNLVLNIFAPIAAGEFHRVLAENGILVRVVPRERHLFGLKSAIYEHPYLNPAVEQCLEGFTALDRIDLDWTIRLDCSEDIQNLFMMTPYYYKTSAEDQARLRQVQCLQTELSFAILVDKKA